MTSPAASDRSAGISVVVNTLDAERHLPYMLRSVAPWVDEIVVVDMASNDRTVAVARDFGARVVMHRRCDSVEFARGFAVAQATQPWILVLDADELVPIGLSRRLRQIAAAGAADAVRIPRVNFLLGGPLLHTGWNPQRERHLRFFRPASIVVPTRLHQPFRAASGARMLDLPYIPGEALLHFNYTDIDDFVDRLTRYTSNEAADAIAHGERSSAFRALADACGEWAVRYLWHGGWRDGWRGFYLTAVMACYRVIVQAKIASRERLGTAADVDRSYVRVAEQVLDDYRAVPQARGVDRPPDAMDPSRS